MSTGRIPANAAAATLRILLTAVIMVVVYRFLLDALGQDRLGVWALVVAVTAAGGVGGLGLNGTLVRHVAAAAGGNQAGERIEMLHTAVRAGGVSILAVGLLLWVAGVRLLPLVVPDVLLPSAVGILPAALASFWISSVAGLYQSYCEGVQRYVATNIITLGGTMVFGAVCMQYVPRYGLPAVAAAALLQSVCTLLAFLMLCRMLPDRIPILPRRWNRAVFRRLLPYGARLQAMSASVLLYDPVTKFLVGWFGGVGETAYYDLASRLIGISRQALVAPSATLLPVIAGWQSSAPDRLPGAHGRAYRLMFAGAALLLLGPLALAPGISLVWLGAYVPGFVAALMLLAAGWFVNTISAPSYTFFLGLGELRWPLISHAVLALLNPLLGLLGGVVAGPAGVVAGFALALAAGSLLTLIAYQRREGSPIAVLFDPDVVRPAVWTMLAVLACQILLPAAAPHMDPPLVLVAGVTLFGVLWWVGMRRTPVASDIRALASALTESAYAWVRGGRFLASRLFFRLAYSNKFPFVSFTRNAAFLEGLRRRIVAEHGLVPGRADGCRVYLDVRNGTELLIWIGRFERDLRRFLRRETREGDTVVDAGAHIGVHTLLFSRAVGVRGHVAAFEPVPVTAGRLEQHLRENGCTNVRVVPCALGEEEGMRTMEVPGDSAFASLGVPAGGGYRTERVQVRVTTLDAYAASQAIERINILKIDVEGHEIPLLRGARRLVQEGRIDLLVVELNRKAQEGGGHGAAGLLRYLGETGWEVARLEGSATRRLDEEAGVPDYAELVCRRRRRDALR